jgi:hypothetical protein
MQTGGKFGFYLRIGILSVASENRVQIRRK